MEKRIADYKIIKDKDGNRYKFYCELSGALVCTSDVYAADTPEEELWLAWENEGKKAFNPCHKCGKLVADVVFNVEVLQCVECAPFETNAMGDTEELRYKNMESFGFGPNIMRKTKVCTKCGQMVKRRMKNCPACSEKLPMESLLDSYTKQLLKVT